jgi:subtilase family serine protease
LNFNRTAAARPAAIALIASLVAGLAACGGGSTDASSSAVAAQDTTSTSDTAGTTTADASSVDLSQVEVQPAYHMAQVELDTPSDEDAAGTGASASHAGASFTVSAELAELDTKRLTLSAIESKMADVRLRAQSVSAQATTKPATTALTGAVYTPAQIRAAYGLSALPASYTGLSVAAAAALGAGQTIYILDAYHDATALTDLNLFSAKFGLPTCTNVAIATTATLPLATPAAKCTLSVVVATSAGAMTTTLPTVSGSWLVESKLDVQWAHAIAPLARIVLIETPNSMTNSLLGGVALANKMGKGVVSMSFGSAEAGWAATVDSKFAGTGMTYVAASGDVGGVVNWPSVSPNVLAVGGTGLKWTGSGTRYEEAWSAGGGGVSAYEALPAWQSGLTAGGAALTKRGVADVSFNANPLTGQYVAETIGTAATKWASVGGTSVGTPQWAGIIAVANAIRVANSKAVLGHVHEVLYKTIAAVPGTYASSFGDVTVGSNGTCTVCTATTGFDTATGLGSPNTTGLLAALVK